MQFTLLPSKDLPSESHIVELEAMLKCTLPIDYRTFLKKYNSPTLFPLEGSSVSDDACIAIFAKPSDACEPEWWFVRFIGLALGNIADEYGLLQEYEFMANCGSHLPDLLAFADDGGGVKFHLCVRGECAGSIFMAGDRYIACLDDGRTPALGDYTKICESFNAFLDALRWIEYDKDGNEFVSPAR